MCRCRALGGMFNRIISPGQDFLQHKNPNGSAQSTNAVSPGALRREKAPMRSIPVISFVTLVWYSIAIRRSWCQNSGSIVTEVFCPRSTRVRLLGRPVSVLTPARNACTRRWTPPRRFAWFGAKVLQSAAERATTNPYGITLSHVWTDWAAQHGVSETIAAAPGLFPGTGRSARSWLSSRRARWSEWSLSSKACLTAFRLDPRRPQEQQTHDSGQASAPSDATERSAVSQKVTKPRRVTGWLGGPYPEATLTRKVNHPRASELYWRRWVGENPQLFEQAEYSHDQPWSGRGRNSHSDSVGT